MNKKDALVQDYEGTAGPVAVEFKETSKSTWYAELSDGLELIDWSKSVDDIKAEYGGRRLRALIAQHGDLKLYMCPNGSHVSNLKTMKMGRKHD